MPAKGKHRAAKGTPKEGEALGKANHAGGSADLAAEVKRLAREGEAIKAMLSQRQAAGHDGGAARRDQGKLVADRPARLGEKVETGGDRGGELEERLGGARGGRA